MDCFSEGASKHADQGGVIIILHSYPEIITWLQTKEQELYGNHFKIIEEDYPIVYRLIAYNLKDEQACFQFGINLSKGILLSGLVGCGKT